MKKLLLQIALLFTVSVSLASFKKIDKPIVDKRTKIKSNKISGLVLEKTTVKLGFIKLTDESGLSRTTQDLENTVHYFVLTASLLFTLAIGISIGVLLFRQVSVKMLKFASRKNKS